MMMALKALWAMRPAHSFWQIWISITAAAAIGVVVAVRPSSRNATKRPLNPILTWRQVGTPRAVAALILLAVFLVSYIAMTLVWEDFAYYDDSIFTLHTLQGHDFPPPIWRGEGRFFPLAVQEFNLIRHFTDTVIGYYLLPIIELLIFSFILLILDIELSITARAILAILVLMTPSILISFNNLHGPEHNILFFLACLVLFVSRFERTQSIASAVAAVVGVQLMIYCKETAFLLVLGFATGRLILRCRAARGAGWDYNRLWESQSRLDLCLAALAVLFLFYYTAGMALYHYVERKEVVFYGTTLPRATTALTYAKTDCLAWLFMALLNFVWVRRREG